jgi:hypothetical protein
VRIAATFTRQNVREASKGHDNDPEFLAAVRAFEEHSKERAAGDKSARPRSQLLHEMKEAEGAEAAFAKKADRYPERAKRPARWYPGEHTFDRRSEWSAC